MRADRIELLKEMLKAQPNDVFLQYALALEYKGAGKQEAAVQQLYHVLSLDNSYQAAYYQLGELLIQLNRADESVEFLKRGLEIAIQNGDNKAQREFAELILVAED